jgi:hypothetical protein
MRWIVKQVRQHTRCNIKKIVHEFVSSRLERNETGLLC